MEEDNLILGEEESQKVTKNNWNNTGSGFLIAQSLLLPTSTAQEITGEHHSGIVRRLIIIIT